MNIRTLIVYDGTPKAFLKHCVCDLEKRKLVFEGNEIEKISIIGETFNIKDWVRDYIETH